MTRATVYVAALLDLGVAAAVGAVGAALKAAAGALTPWILAVVLLALRGPEEARAQRATGDDLDQKSWAGLMTGGYSTAIGDDFGGGSSVGFTAGLYRIRSPTFKLGVEVGYDRLGGYTNTYFDIHGPGITQIEKFNWSVLRAAAVARVQLARSSIRPVGIIGFGAYMVRTRDDIEAFDPNGVSIPMYRFLQIRTTIRPGATVGLGVELPNALGRLTMGAEARWNGLFDLGPGGVAMGNFATFTISVGFD